MVVSLPPLPQGQQIVQQDGTASLAFTVYWQQLIDNLGGTLTNITSILDSIVAAQAAAAAAQATANLAMTDAEKAAREGARINSYTSPSNVITATAVGATATITVAAHVRIYPVQGSIDVPDVSIASGSITGLAQSTTYYVYYTDGTLVNTAPTFLASTFLATASVGAAPGRHYVGKVLTPPAAGAPTNGVGNPPTGGGSGDYIP